jgi:type IV pilus assembly protein PilM
MSMWDSISRLVKDPPPAHVFELSAAGIAYAHGAETGFAPLPEGALEISPVEDNVRQLDAIMPVLGQFASTRGTSRGTARGGKRRSAAVLLPDACARVSVLDFDAFPETPAEQISLVRFRIKKTIPFDIDSASVGYYVQRGGAKHGQAQGKGHEKTEVVAVIVTHEILARYEALFRNAGFQPGDVTVSALAALNLYKGQEAAVLARLAGNTLTVMVVAEGKLRLFRCLPLEEASAEEIRAVLYPTFAYAEDELGTPVRRLILCGFDESITGLPCESEPLRGRLGVAGAFNAGLLGYLEASPL